MNFRYEYASCASTSNHEAFNNAHFHSHCPIRAINTIPEAISPNGTGFLQAVEATKHKDRIIIRVLIKNHHGINVHIPCPDSNVVMYHKYLDLRYSIRNTGDKILLTFPELFVKNGKGGLYLYSTDFKVFDPEHPDFPRIFEI